MAAAEARLGRRGRDHPSAPRHYLRHNHNEYFHITSPSCAIACCTAPALLSSRAAGCRCSPRRGCDASSRMPLSAPPRVIGCRRGCAPAAGTLEKTGRRRLAPQHIPQDLPKKLLRSFPPAPSGSLKSIAHGPSFVTLRHRTAVSVIGLLPPSPQH